MKWLGIIALTVSGACGLYAQALPPAIEALKAPLEIAVEPPMLALPVEAPAPVQAALVQLPTAQEVSDMRAQLKEKDALISKLTKHLESALARLNKTQSPLTETSASVAALKAAKTKLEQQNEVLKAKQQQLLAQNAELARKKQVLDLENRQLFQALNGRPTQDSVPAERVAKKSEKVAAEKKLALGQ